MPFYKQIYKQIFLLIIFCFAFPGHLGRASQNISQERIIPVKIIFDQYFVRNFYEVKAKEPAVLPGYPMVTPENFTQSIIEQLSVRYRQFNIRFLPIATEQIFIKERVLLDAEYMEILKQRPCQNAELIFALTGVAFVSTSPGGGKFVVVSGSADRQVGRLFSQFGPLGIIMNPKLDVENMIDTLDHETRHIFGTSHKKEGVLDNAEQKKFLQEGTSVIWKNRLQKFTCTEPNGHGKK